MFDGAGYVTIFLVVDCTATRLVVGGGTYTVVCLLVVGGKYTDDCLLVVDVK